MPMTPPPPLDNAAVEAARYALLRRIAPAIRHEAVAHLQPISMVSSLLERRLTAPQPDLAQVADGVRRLTASSRAAVQSCLDVITWLAPDTARVLPLREAVADTLQLLGGSLAFRGFVMRNEVAGLDTPVGAASLRYVLPACLLWLTDSAGPPAEVTLTAQDAGAQAQLRLELTPTDAPEGLDSEPAWRALRSEEVAALARAEGIGYVHEGDVIILTLARAS